LEAELTGTAHGDDGAAIRSRLGRQSWAQLRHCRRKDCPGHGGELTNFLERPRFAT